MNWRLIISLSLVSFTVGADEFALAPLLGLIGDDLSVEPVRVAWFVTAYALPLSLLAPFFGGLSDRVGRKRVLLPALLVFAVANIGLANAGTFETGIAWRLLAGIGAAGILSNAFAWVSDAIPPSGQARAMGFVQLGLTLGLILSPAGGAWLATLLGWRAVFLVIAAVALLAVLAMAPLNTPVASTSGGRASVRDVLRRPATAAGLGTHALGLGVAVGCYALLGQLLQDRYELAALTAGIVLGGFGVATVAGNAATGVMAERAGGPAAAARMSLAVVGISVSALFLFTAIPLPIALLLIAAWAIAGGCFAPSQQVLLASVAGEDRGRVLALAGAAMNLAVAGTTAIAPVLYERFGSREIGVLALVAFGCACLLASRRRSTGPAVDGEPG